MRAEVGKWPDLLDMDYINGLPQPLYWLDGPKWVWPVHDFEVGSGCFRIDVMGRLDVKHIGDATQFRDASGKVHLADDFYLDPECWVERASPRQGTEHG